MKQDARLIKKQLFLFLSAALVTLVTACGGGGGGGSSLAPSASGGTPANPPTTSPSGGATAPPTVTMSLTVTIPGKKSSSRARGPQYIAPNSGSMTMTLLTVNGVAISASAQGPYDLVPGPTNPNCVAGTNTTCTFSISAPVGTDIFLANTYSSSNGTGQPLGSGSVLLSVKQNATNTASLDLTGPVSSVQVVSATTVLYNGNPIPAPECSDCSVARGHGAQDAQRNRAAASSSRSIAARSTTAGATRKPAVTSTPPPTPGPVNNSSRIFVIALDSQGNEIINPTTYDIPINLTLSLNGLPAGDATLTVTYAGLTGEPTSPTSTSSDGGTVGVFAPSDSITLTVSGTTAAQSSPITPTVTAGYTPQGGSAQTSTPLTFDVYIPPPAPNAQVLATHIDPFTSGIAAVLTMGFTNIGTAPTSGTIYLSSDFDGTWSYNGTGVGSDPSWNCVNNSDNPYYSEIDCSSNAVVAAGASLPLVLNVTPSSNTPDYNDVYASGGNAVDTQQGDIYAYDTINVLAATPILSIAQSTNPLQTDGNFTANVAGSFTITVSNTGTLATTSTISLADTLPTGMNGAGAGTGWTCGAQAGQTITCTTNAVLAASGGTAPVITMNVTPTTAVNLTNSLTATSTGAVSGNINPGVTVYGPLALVPQSPSAPDHLQLFLGGNGTLQAQAPYYNGTLTAAVVNGGFGSPPCSNYLSIPSPSLSGPTANFSVAPAQVTGFTYNAGNPGTYCTISVSDVNGRSTTIPVTVTSIGLTGQ
jgi:hypothetical protein